MKHISRIHHRLDLLQPLQIIAPILARPVVAQRTINIPRVRPKIVAQSIGNDLIQACEEVTDGVVDTTEEVDGVRLVVEQRIAVAVGRGIGVDVVDGAAFEVPDEEPCEGAFVGRVDVLEELVDGGVWDEVVFGVGEGFGVEVGLDTAGELERCC